MKQKQNINHQCPSLPVEIIDRLMKLRTHSTLPEQSMSFSVDLPCGNERRLRWNRRFNQLPHPHIIEVGKHGETMALHVLHQETGYVLKISYEGGNWTRVSSKPLSHAERQVPNRHHHANKRWFRKPSTIAQRRMIDRILDVTPEQLPPLTAYNAALIIDTHRLMAHLRRIQMMIELWGSELGHNSSEQLLPFTEWKSA